MVLGRGQSVGRPQVVGHERRLRHVVAREVVVVHREQNDVFEIEVAGFEDAHDLHPFERLALVGDAHGLQMAAQQRGVNLRRQLDVALVQRIAEFGNLLRNHGQKLHALTLIMRHYHPEHTDFNPAAIPRTRVLKLEVTSMTGKRRMTSAK